MTYIHVEITNYFALSMYNRSPSQRPRHSKPFQDVNFPIDCDMYRFIENISQNNRWNSTFSFKRDSTYNLVGFIKLEMS